MQEHLEEDALPERGPLPTALGSKAVSTASLPLGHAGVVWRRSGRNLCNCTDSGRTQGVRMKANAVIWFGGRCWI